MHKSEYDYTCAGCDTSKDTIDVVRYSNGRSAHRRFNNTTAGHKHLIQWLTGPGQAVRVVVEASGIYSLDLALALHEAKRVEIMVANPRALKDYRRAHMQRSKTDKVDATIICDYARRMPFIRWQPPSSEVLELQQIARRIHALIVERSREKNRLRTAHATVTTSPVVINDIEVNLRHLDRRIGELEKQALRRVTASAAIKEAHRHLTSVPGISDRSAVQLLAEILVLPQGLSVREWVAFEGLDVRRYESGTSVERPRRISRVGNVRLRRALYMPALVAIRHDEAIGAFYAKLLGRGKKPLVAIVAVMRKLLHAIYGMLKHDADFDGSKFYRIPPQAA
ncbi:MAG TPA: IS110 family transposase [Rhodothermales bacterium]|nr:IS110 family transposase [Rhodothermales bacterium]